MGAIRFERQACSKRLMAVGMPGRAGAGLAEALARLIGAGVGTRAATTFSGQ